MRLAPNAPPATPTTEPSVPFQGGVARLGGGGGKSNRASPYGLLCRMEAINHTHTMQQFNAPPPPPESEENFH